MSNPCNRVFCDRADNNSGLSPKSADSVVCTLPCQKYWNEQGNSATNFLRI